MNMNDQQKQAYEWSLNQQYQSVAASYARTQAEYIRDSQNPQPLTMEELRQMDGEPVWVVSNRGNAGWGFVFMDRTSETENPYIEIVRDYKNGNRRFSKFSEREYEAKWSAYRIKPEPPEGVRT